jgi:hypothetical protein
MFFIEVPFCGCRVIGLDQSDGSCSNDGRNSQLCEQRPHSVGAITARDQKNFGSALSLADDYAGPNARDARCRKTGAFYFRGRAESGFPGGLAGANRGGIA